MGDLADAMWEAELWEDDRLFWIAESSEYLFQDIHHRWWPAEEEDSLWTRRRKMSAKNFSGDAPGSLWPSHWRLFQDMITVEDRMRLDIPFPLISNNNVGLSLVGKDQKQFRIESLRKDPADDRDHRRNARAAGDEPRLLRHAIDSMAALARTAHQHRVAHALVMQVLRHDAGFVAFYGEIEETRSTR